MAATEAFREYHAQEPPGRRLVRGHAPLHRDPRCVAVALRRGQREQDLVVELRNRRRAGAKSKGVILVEVFCASWKRCHSLAELGAMHQKDGEEGLAIKAIKTLQMLQFSPRTSMPSWVCASTEALDETKSTLLRIPAGKHSRAPLHTL